MAQTAVIGKTYKFEWNDRTADIFASTYSSARRQFQERFGFFPDENTVNITILEEGTS